MNHAVKLPLLVIAISCALAGCGPQSEAANSPQTSTSKGKEELISTHELFSNAAERGDAEAQYQLGIAYSNGEGVAKDLTKAFDWTRKAAEQGHAGAQFSLGDAYSNGEGVAKDPTKAFDWYRKAAEQGHARAQANLGFSYHAGEGVAKDLTKAFDWTRKAAEQGYARAQANLGVFYYNGYGVAKDLIKAVEWTRKAAEQGHAGAQFDLGFSYYAGEGVAKDLTKAFDWYRKAAEQGDDRAQFSLGEAYSRGEGVAKDSVLAYAWSNIAAGTGNEHAAKNRNFYELHLSKAELAEAQRLSSAWKLGSGIAREGRTGREAAGEIISGKFAKNGTGTLFVVGKAGHAITNQHVVDGCAELRVEGRDGTARLITEDKVNDLALLQIPGENKATAPISDAPSKLRQGEDIVVFGFPLNALLSSGGNLTPGVVSALTGLGNNTNQIQITAPIQPGSSGSAVMNKKGEVVAVVSMKLSDTKMVKATGSVGQNVNFAVSGQTLKTFLDTNKVEYKTGGFLSFEKSTADLADEARKWTTVVQCWK